jgi:quercetin dioxygenase-like cupin family protein
MPSAAEQAFVALAGEGRVYEVLGTTTTLVAGHHDTGQRCEVIQSVFPPQGGLPRHVHNRADEALYVVDGAVEAEVGQRTATARAGSFIFIPRGTVHAFHNASAQPCTLLVTYLPKLGEGIEAFLNEASQLPPGPPDMAVLLPILERHDLAPR